MPVVISVVGVGCAVSILLAVAPPRWNDRGFIKKVNGLPVAANDFAAANHGQLKEFAVPSVVHPIRVNQVFQQTRRAGRTLAHGKLIKPSP